ncbi:MAG: RNA polymerase sigma factor [Oscillospiraceae bacterium]|nr:RNA polymerase sigma factor [Oscillospiraceae bacterium]
MDEHDNDQRLIELYLSRDKSAVGETMNIYGKRLLRLAVSFLGDMCDAEECVNDTYLKAWNSIPPQQPSDLFSYLARLCRCTAYNIIDKRQAAKRCAHLVELTHEMEECIPDNSQDVTTEDELISVLINEFLGTLTDDKCDMFVKRYWYGASVDMIAKEMDFSKSKVKTTLHRTRAGLKNFLEKKGVSP